MPPKGRKNGRSLPHDILSNLPDNVIDTILMCLPPKDAVRTSILSKKWKYRWCGLTEFKLYEWDCDNPLAPHVKFTKIINQLLTHHVGPVTKFTLHVDSLSVCPNIDDFICFLSMNGIKDLVLHFPVELPYKFSFSLFTFDQLRHLSLHDCIIQPPSFFKGLNMLTSLELYRVSNFKFLGSFISQCPLLEQLVLKEISEDLGVIVINAPKLRYFLFKGCITAFRLENVPVMAKASVTGDWFSCEVENLDIAKVYDSFSDIDYDSIQLSKRSADLVPARLPFNLDGVKQFFVPFMQEDDSYSVACVFCLMKSFPCLEYLEIVMYSDNDNPALLSLETELADVTFNHLRKVKLTGFGGTAPELQLIKLLLAKSTVLVKIVIESTMVVEQMVLYGISLFWRASLKAVVVYKTVLSNYNI